MRNKRENSLIGSYYGEGDCDMRYSPCVTNDYLLHVTKSSGFSSPAHGVNRPGQAVPCARALTTAHHISRRRRGAITTSKLVSASSTLFAYNLGLHHRPSSFTPAS
ncbi:hypothetical protein ElyMa_000528200 [Elysia marginata]|uniref:Uncharacterized protein n=1 Tax=Elysia marginata TaxID=1093978 RepID=A0AAV4G0M6_9GAST|nr:hypothetical protein ElyMa_000528200 [Elysia marginata]